MDCALLGFGGMTPLPDRQDFCGDDEILWSRIERVRTTDMGAVDDPYEDPGFS
jgi:hypothetical protein